MGWKPTVVFTIVLSAAASLTHAQTDRPLRSVADLIEIAMQRNREFLAARERVAETQGLLRQAGVRPAPAIELEETSSRPFGSHGEQVFTAGVFQTIETSGKRDKRLAVAQRTAESAEAELADQLRLLTLDVKLRYSQATRERQKLDVLERLLAANRQYSDLMRQRVERGDAPALEAQLLFTEMSRVEAQRIVMVGSADRAVLELRKVTGLAVGEPLALAAAAPPPAAIRALGDLQIQAVRDRADLRVLRGLEAQARAEEVLTGAEGTPDITASARYARTHSQFDQLGLDGAGHFVPIQDRDHVLSIGLSFLVLSPKRNQGALLAAQARTTAARLRREHLESAVRLDVEAALRRWESARDAVDILTRGVMGPSERNLAVLRQAYDLGQIRLLDVLNEQRRLIETQLGFLDAQAEMFAAFAELEASVGGSIQ